MFRNKPPTRMVQNTTNRGGAYLGTSREQHSLVQYRTLGRSIAQYRTPRRVMIAPYASSVPHNTQGDGSIIA
eukprot:995467-Rhodomonas_salina.1